MKIEQDMRPTISNTQKELNNKPIGSGKFSELVEKSEQKLQIHELNNLLNDIDIQGSKLAQSRTFQELAKYKKFVKRFIQEAVANGLSLKQSQSFGFNGKSRQHKIVKKVDEHLIDLTKDVMDKEKKSIDILDKIGEIKGLLINLYM